MNITKIVYHGQRLCIILYLECKHYSNAVSPLVYPASLGGTMTLPGPGFSELLSGVICGWRWCGVGGGKPTLSLVSHSGQRSEGGDLPLTHSFWGCSHGGPAPPLLLLWLTAILGLPRLWSSGLRIHLLNTPVHTFLPHSFVRVSWLKAAPASSRPCPEGANH